MAFGFDDFAQAHYSLFIGEHRRVRERVARTPSERRRLSAAYFLNRLSKAARASAGVRGELTTGPFAVVVASRATVTRGENNSHWLASSFGKIRAGIGFRHWNRVEGSKCAHCLQQCNAEPHLGQFARKSAPVGNVVAQFQHRDAVTVCTIRGSLGPVISMGSLGPGCLGRSSRPRPFISRSTSMYPRCLYLRSSSMGPITLLRKLLLAHANLVHPEVPRLHVVPAENSPRLQPTPCGRSPASPPGISAGSARRFGGLKEHHQFTSSYRF